MKGDSRSLDYSAYGAFPKVQSLQGGLLHEGLQYGMSGSMYIYIYIHAYEYVYENASVYVGFPASAALAAIEDVPLSCRSTFTFGHWRLAGLVPQSNPNLLAHKEPSRKILLAISCNTEVSNDKPNLQVMF